MIYRPWKTRTINQINMIKARKVIDRFLAIALIITMTVLVIDVVWQVLARYIVKSPSSFTDELARFLLIWVGLLGSAYAMGKKKHLAIDILPSKLTGRPRILLDNFISILIIAFAALVLVVGGIRLVYITLNLNQISPALGVPLGYVYLVLPFSGLLIIFYGMYDILIKE
jgi:TRAP-type C4-dicarboxylate transport system permease small subunit